MKTQTKFARAVLVTVAAALGLSACTSSPDPALTAYENARWREGDGYAEGVRYVRDGRFVAPGRRAPGTIVDLEGRYAVPPLGDAHMHGFDDGGRCPEEAAAFFADGIAYVASLGGFASGRDAVTACLAAPGAPSVLRANGMITAPGRHPIINYEARAAGKSPWSLTDEEKAELFEAARLAGDVYWLAATPDDVAAFWPDYLAQGPDVVKVILDGERGVPPDALAAIAERARAAGLPLFAHVQSAGDAKMAIAIGADALAHAPDYDKASPPLPAQLLARLAEAGVAVTPTFARELAMEPWVPDPYKRTDDEKSKLRAAHAARLDAMEAAGVTLLAGYDLGGGSSLDELAYWQEIGALDGRTILRIGAVDTPQTLFPDRAVGCLEPGCEASFAVLSRDPAEDIRAYEEPRLMIVRGARANP